jgi:hypothetical protein
MIFRSHPSLFSSRRIFSGGVIALIALGAACNHSRYGVSYDERLPHLKRIAVVPGAVDVFSLHSGGTREARPDMTEETGNRTSDNLLEALAKRGVEGTLVSGHPSADDKNPRDPSLLALLGAVRDSIITHHYLYGSARIFSYSTGSLAKLVTNGDSVDAVLWYFMTGVVPTKGREALKTTAIVVGVLTGVHLFVDTDEAIMVLMLVDVNSGEVLWFNQERAKADVRDAKDIRKLVKSATRYLLEPRK